MIIKTFLNGKLHSFNGKPAWVKYYENGNVEYEVYYENGNRHRLNGPATIEYWENGNIKYEHYYENGKLLDKEIFY